MLYLFGITFRLILLILREIPLLLTDFWAMPRLLRHYHRKPVNRWDSIFPDNCGCLRCTPYLAEIPKGLDYVAFVALIWCLRGCGEFGNVTSLRGLQMEYFRRELLNSLALEEVR